MKQFTFRLSLNSDEVMLMYEGPPNGWWCSEQGLTLELGMKNTPLCVAINGVHGYFQLKTQDDYRFISLERIN